MIIRFLLAAVVAGLISGVLMTGAQELKVTPLILHAEQYESGAVEHSAVKALPGLSVLAEAISPVTPALAHGDEEAEGGILFGLDRFGGTLMANLVTGAGFGLLLFAASVITGVSITLRNGVLWGAAGWLAFQFLPANRPAARSCPVFRQPISTTARPGGWRPSSCRRSGCTFLSCVLSSGPRCWGSRFWRRRTFTERRSRRISPATWPALLGAEFAVAALATTAFFWVVLGLLLGGAMDRTARTG